MLLNFRFSNFKSFEELAHFSMITGRSRQHPDNFFKEKNFNVLTFSAIYGLNAGGKSNFVDAIGLSRAMILNDLQNLRIYNRFNKNNPENQHAISNFEYEIAINNQYFVYGFSIILNKYKVVKEYLIDITDEKNEIPIFTRDEHTNETNININFDYLNLDKDTINRINVYKNDLPTSVLFLQALNSNHKKRLTSKNNKKLITESVFNWFKDVLEVISPEGTTDHYAYLNKQHLEELGKYLNAFDTGVSKVKFHSVSEDAIELPLQIREKIFEDILSSTSKGALIRTGHNIFKVQNKQGDIDIQEIRFIHASKNVSYSLEEESDGTKRIIDIFSILLDTKHKVYVVDELDRSLHPNLSYKFVEEFINQKSKNQLIVTTHEERLLDLNLLRRDQVWFVERNNYGNSSLYSLEEYKERFDTNIRKQYLDGRYGSVPNMDFNFSTIVKGE